MAKTFTKYKIEELLYGNDGIIIATNAGTDISIQVVDDKTLVLFPFGNELRSPEVYGHLSTGMVAIAKRRPTPPKRGDG